MRIITRFLNNQLADKYLKYIIFGERYNDIKHGISEYHTSVNTRYSNALNYF